MISKLAEEAKSNSKAENKKNLKELMKLQKEMTSSLMSAKESRKEGFKESLTNMGGMISEDEAKSLADAAIGDDSQS